MGVVDSLMTVLGGDKLKNMFDDNWLDAWKDPALKDVYQNLKPILRDKYGSDAAKYIGFLEDSETLWNDVISASEETGTDANLLYIFGMQEGMSMDMAKYNKKYEDIDFLDTYNDIGLDNFFNIQDTLLEKGYLTSEITSLGGYSWTRVNEAGMEIQTGRILPEDAWRAMGATIKTYEDQMKNVFNNRDMDYDSLTDSQKNFWTYAAYNAGAGNASKLLDTYGFSPFEDEELNDALKLWDDITTLGQETGNAFDKKYIEGNLQHVADEWFASSDKDRQEMQEMLNLHESSITPDQNTISFIKENQEMLDWIRNIGRVTGGIELMNVHSPFDFPEYGPANL